MKITIQTLARTIVLAAALVNQILTAAGCNPLPFSNEEYYPILSSAVTLAAAAWSWWKNNSFTDAAKKADLFLAALRKENENLQPPLDADEKE